MALTKEQIIDKFLVQADLNYKLPVEVGAVFDKKYMDSLPDEEFRMVIINQLKKVQMYALAQFNEIIAEIENDGQ